jgi:hypothetical protein
MSDSLKKLWNDYGIAGILIIVVGLYVLHMMYKYFSNKGSSSGMPEGNTNNNNNAYNNQPSSSVMPAVENQSDEFASTSGSQQMMSAGGSCGANTTNPADLLPKDNNNDWSKLNPSGSGPLSNINLLKAGALIGIDTIGQTLRNANLQIRSEPPNPQLSVGPWNQSTITPDFMRPPMEIGQGAQ